MYILLKDGTKLVKPWGVGGITGFVADEVTITDRDALMMKRQLDQNPKEFMLYMTQFLARFPINRVS